MDCYQTPRKPQRTDFGAIAPPPHHHHQHRQPIPPFGFSFGSSTASAASSSSDSITNANAPPAAAAAAAATRPTPGPFGPLPRPPTAATPSRPRPNPFNQPCTPIIHTGGLHATRKRSASDADGDEDDDDDDDMDCDQDMDGPSPTPRKRRLTSRLALSRRVVVGHLLQATPGGSVPMDVDSPMSVARTPAKTPTFSFPSKYAWNLSPSSPSSRTPLGRRNAGGGANSAAAARGPLVPLPCKPSPFFKSHLYKPSPDKMVVIDEESPSAPAQPAEPVPVGLQTPRKWMAAKGTPGSRPRFMRAAEERGEEVPGKRRLFADVAASSLSSSGQDFDHNHNHHFPRPPIPSSPLATSAPLSTLTAAASPSSSAAALRAITGALPRAPSALSSASSTPSKPQSGSRAGLASGCSSPLTAVPEELDAPMTKPVRTRLDFGRGRKTCGDASGMANRATVSRPPEKRVTRATATAATTSESASAQRAHKPVPQSPYLFRGTPQRVREGKSKWVFGK